jgi:transposase
MLRMFKLAKGSAIKSRTQAINQLKAVLVAADPAVRAALSGLSTPLRIRRCAQLPADPPNDATSAAVWTLRLLARRIVELTAEIDNLDQRIAHAVGLHTPSCSHGAGWDPRAPRPCSSPPARPATPPQRGRLRRAVRRQPGPSVLRQDHPPAP